MKLPRRYQGLRPLGGATALHCVPDPDSSGVQGRLPVRRPKSTPAPGRDRRRPLPAPGGATRPGHHLQEPPRALHQPSRLGRDPNDPQAQGPSKTRRNLGPGSGLCQGFIHCGITIAMGDGDRVQGRAPRRRRSYAYYCQGEYRFGGKQCGHIPGEAVDRAVFAAVSNGSGRRASSDPTSGSGRRAG